MSASAFHESRSSRGRARRGAGAKLSNGGEQQPCGWIRDKFGLSWQVIPSILGRLLHDRDPAKADRVMSAMLQMKKIEIAKLKAAYDER